MTDWKNDLLTSNKTAAIPIMTHPGIEQIDKNVLDAVTDGEIQYCAIKILSDKYPSAAAAMIMDLSIEAEAFGSEIVFSKDEIPTVHGRLISDINEITELTIPDLSSGRLPEYLRAAELAAKNISDKPVLAGCIGPFSLAGRLFDFSELMVALLINSEEIEMLLEKITSFLIKYIKAFKETGVNGIVIAEPAAGMLSPGDCKIFSSTFIKTIVDEIQDENFLIVYHNCGNTNNLLKEIELTGAGAFHFGNACEITNALKVIDNSKLVMGNIDPVNIFKMADEQTVYNATIELLNKTSEYKNYILSSGCDVPPHIPEENIRAFYKALEDFNSTKN